MPDCPAGARELLQRYFDAPDFRPGQAEALAAVCAAEDALVILPTGTGKSLVYQLASQLLPGTVLVISPLIALVRDQVRDLEARGFPGVAALHSNIRASEQRRTLNAFREGQLRLLYLTPERFASADFVQAVRDAAAQGTRISLLAVDEAHCVAEWGHDFWPSYLLIDESARAIGRPPIVALTATATPEVRQEIISSLGLREPRVIVRGFDRPNLFFEVYQAPDEREKQRWLSRLIARAEADYAAPLAGPLAQASAGSGLIYTALTRTARSLSQALNRDGVHAAYYHGQLKASQRNAVHERFREGSVRAIAATNAFGLGIDRGDLRYVVHYDAPGSLEEYFQEAGRAGRDGELARCALLFSSDDLSRALFRSSTGAIDVAHVERVAAVLAQATTAVSRDAIAEQTGLAATDLVRVLRLLLSAGAISNVRGRYRTRDLDAGRLQRAMAHDEHRQAHDRTRTEMLRSYAQVDGCRRQFLLQYFGEYDAPATCGMCDRCVPRLSERPAAVARPVAAAPRERAFNAGDTVEHDSLGSGVVQHVEHDRLLVNFAGAGYRTLDLDGVVERGLLRVVSQVS